MKTQAIAILSAISLICCHQSFAKQVFDSKEACIVNLKTDSTCFCKIRSLHPTQMTVGIKGMKDKRDELKEMGPDKLEKYEKNHPEPTVIGPGGDLYIIDHHHLALALQEAGNDSTYCHIEANFSHLSQNEFWANMEEKKWVYPYDNGQGPFPFSQLPSSVEQLRDDPYRSLAGAVRDAGDFDKTDAPFAEFLWADFFRSRINSKDVEEHFKDAVKSAGKLAHSDEANKLPGFKSH